MLASGPYESKYTKGHVMEILADPDDSATIAALCKTAIRYFRKQKVDTLGALLSDERFIAVFRKFLFFKGTGGKAILLGNLKKCGPDKDDIQNMHTWHFGRGESDGFMLSP